MAYSENTNLRESLTVQLSSCLFCLDLAALNEQQRRVWQKFYLISCLVKYKPVKQEVSGTVILPLW